MPRGAEKYPKNSTKYIYTITSVRYSIILTTSAMFHVHYLDIYQTMLTDEFRNFIDKTMNCEDILINAVVAKYLNDRFGYTVCPCLHIKGEDKIKNMERENPGNLDNINESMHHTKYTGSVKTIFSCFLSDPINKFSMQISHCEQSFFLYCAS